MLYVLGPKQLSVFYYKAECGYLLFIALIRSNTSKDWSHKTRLILINRSKKCFR